MSGWADEELQRIGGAEELRLASRRQDGSLRPFATMWVVRVGNDLSKQTLMSDVIVVIGAGAERSEEPAGLTGGGAAAVACGQRLACRPALRPPRRPPLTTEALWSI